MTHLSPSESESLFRELGGMNPSRSSLDRLPKGVSEKWELGRREWEPALRAQEDRWAAKNNDPYSEAQVSVFSQPPSKVNPHNLYLQVYFESGLFGLVAYAMMLLILFWQSIKLTWSSQNESRIFAAVSLAYLTGHVILGLTNGLWLGLGPSLALVALLENVRRSEKRA